MSARLRLKLDVNILTLPSLCPLVSPLSGHSLDILIPQTSAHLSMFHDVDWLEKNCIGRPQVLVS